MSSAASSSVSAYATHHELSSCSESERTLVDRMRRGQQRAFDQFFDAYASRIGAFAARRASLDEQSLEDVVQVTMIKAMRGLDGYRGDSELFTWLCQICRNHLADLRRQTARQPGTQSFELLTAEDRSTPTELVDWSDPLEQCDLDSTRDAVRNAINQLQTSYARILGLRYGDEFSVPEIARTLELTVRATESRLGRARRAFAAMWNE